MVTDLVATVTETARTMTAVETTVGSGNDTGTVTVKSLIMRETGRGTGTVIEAGKEAKTIEVERGVALAVEVEGREGKEVVDGLGGVAEGKVSLGCVVSYDCQVWTWHDS